ncbi:MAG: glycosyl transferase family protein [Gammaproteobacteria bacterium]|nr:glycosyl transferase family protein [Gammaproteobacteria bacterium]
MQQHPFAPFIQALGKGKKGSRSLTFEEAEAAMSMILDGQTTPEQLGAFLMLIRVKEESPEELAGFIRAARNHVELPSDGTALPTVDLDWSSYAGKRRHLPWFVLAARLLAERAEIRVFMHGTPGNKDDRIYCNEALRSVGLPVCESIEEVGRAVADGGFADLGLEHLSPGLTHILELRRLFGLRSPINTLLRMLNPLSAPYLMQGIFHPNYRDVHQQAAVLLGQPNMVVFKGEGGEAERNPDGECQVLGVRGRETVVETWPTMFTRRHIAPETLDISRLAALWNGEIEDEYGEAAVIGTAAIALRLLERATDPADAETQARALWLSRLR